MKTWEPKKPITKKAADALAAYPPFLRDLLYSRGIGKAEEAEKFLHPSYERDLHDPFLMKDMKKAVKRVAEAIEKGERIVVYGDYDADGVPGTAILAEYFREIGFKNFDIYIPDRGLEGYGMKDEAIGKLAADGVKLIITVDCGIVDVSQTKKAKELGIDMVITDHHLPQEKLPKAVAIVDNKQEKDGYPFKFLCGAATAWKLVVALMREGSHQFREGWEKWLLDLVAIATVSDMVPLEGENRALAYFGLKVLRKTRRPGLDALFRSAKLRKDSIGEDDIGFTIAPRLNVASRMSHGVQSYYLLTTGDPDLARDIAKHLEDKNKERKAMVEQVVAAAEEQIGAMEAIPDILVVGDPAWMAGGLSLAANKLKDKYGKSVFIWGSSGNGLCKGSARSDGQSNLVRLMQAAGGDDYFAEFGGHFMAAGFSVAPEKVGELSERLNQAFALIDKEPYAEEVIIDKELGLDEITWENYYFVEEMGPYGVGNPKPVFLLKSAEIDSVKAFGNGGIHLEITFRNSQGKKVPAIGFFAASPAEKFDAVNGHIYQGAILEAGQKIDALVNLEKSTFKNFPELRLRLVDVRKAS